MRWIRTPIRDGGCPTIDELRAILDRIDAELARGEVVYVHCGGGHGRTGTVVGCWLVPTVPKRRMRSRGSTSCDETCPMPLG
jgi:protein-tyrosine phosphatase